MMKKCAQCGGAVCRVRRTFLDRLQYMAVYVCRDCHAILPVPRRYRRHFGRDVCCPICGTVRVAKLRGRDPIDPMAGGFLNFLEKLAGGRLFHCRFCRVQFYDRRNLAPLAASERPLCAGGVGPARMSEEAAIDPDGLAGDKVTPLAGEKSDGAGDVQRYSDAPQGS